ncbi:MAG: hypothetical protein AB8H79_11890 [Myxococcota bacterium]
MTRFIRPLLAATLLFVSAQAQAGELEDRASKVLAEAIQVAQKGDLDTWIKKFCDPERCHTALSKDSWKAYQLKQLAQNGKHCVEGDKVEVVRWRGALGEDPNKAKAYIKCSNRQLPPPVEFRYDKAADKIYIRNTSI